MAYIQSGYIKTNKKDREAIEVFMQHAWNDISYGLEGTYIPLGDTPKEKKEAMREYAKGKQGYELLQWLINEIVK